MTYLSGNPPLDQMLEAAQKIAKITGAPVFVYWVNNASRWALDKTKPTHTKQFYKLSN